MSYGHCPLFFEKRQMFSGKQVPFRKLKSSILSSAILIALLCGCAKEEEENIVVLDTSSEEATYGLITVMRDDVVLSKNLTVTYTQLREQEIAFSSGGKRISKVYVESGDTVAVGDVLISLSTDNLQEKIDELNYNIEKNKLQLGYLDSAEAFDLEDAYSSFVYTGKEIEEEDIDKYEKNKESIQRNYRYKREDLQDEIEFDQKKLNKYQSELNASLVRSNIAGTVYGIKENLEGSTSKKDEVVMTIVDNASGLFEMEEPDYASCFRDGESVEMKIVYGNASGDYELIPHAISSWGETQKFEILTGPDNEGIDVGTTGTLRLILDSREGVLTLPVGAVYHADGKPYVYMLDDNNFRQIVYIDTGLVGDDKVEITRGLKEGDQVVYQ